MSPIGYDKKLKWFLQIHSCNFALCFALLWPCSSPILSDKMRICDYKTNPYQELMVEQTLTQRISSLVVSGFSIE